VLDLTEPDGTQVPAPRWIAPSLIVKEGRDPLGFQTTTSDRLMPVLLPGILELSRRARYFSFHAFLLDEYRQKGMSPDGNSLSRFIKRREWDLGLAVLRCPNKCGSSPVGALRLRGLAGGAGPFPRGESVKSVYGGYGLYYRSPMAALGLVARTGTMLGDKPILIDVLYPSDRVKALVDGFRSAVEGTAYYRRWMWIEEELPAEVIDEYAAAACLCRLRERFSERDAVHAALFGSDPDNIVRAPVLPDSDAEDQGIALLEFSEAGVIQRRRSFAHYLVALQAHPEVVTSEGTYREALWSPPPPRSPGHALVAGQWSALIAKDVWQEAICSGWSEFCRAGLARTRVLGRGLTWEEAHLLASGLTDGPPVLDGGGLTGDVVGSLTAGSLMLDDPESGPLNVRAATVEELRRVTSQIDTATSGLVVLLELARRSEDRSGTGWDQAIHIASAWQPSVGAVLAGLRNHLAEGPSVRDTLWWLVSRFVVPVHERIGYSKLPEFTFRFRWEDGLLRFYDQGIGRFPLAAIRKEPLASLTWDLGMWERTSEGTAALTARAVDFINEVLV